MHLLLSNAPPACCGDSKSKSPVYFPKIMIDCFCPMCIIMERNIYNIFRMGEKMANNELKSLITKLVGRDACHFAL